MGGAVPDQLGEVLNALANVDIYKSLRVSNSSKSTSSWPGLLLPIDGRTECNDIPHAALLVFGKHLIQCSFNYLILRMIFAVR